MSAGRPDDPLEALRERLERTQDAVRKLAHDAEAARAQEGDRPPPRGWEPPRQDRTSGGELAALVTLVDGARDLIPAELRAQFAELVREILLLVRGLVDWYLDRLERARPEPVEVEDIPIE